MILGHLLLHICLCLQWNWCLKIIWIVDIYHFYKTPLIFKPFFKLLWTNFQSRNFINVFLKNTQKWFFFSWKYIFLHKFWYTLELKNTVTLRVKKNSANQPIAGEAGSNLADQQNFFYLQLWQPLDLLPFDLQRPTVPL